MCAQHLSNVLRVREVQCRINLIQDVEWSRFEEKKRENERKSNQRTAGRKEEGDGGGRGGWPAAVIKPWQPTAGHLIVQSNSPSRLLQMPLSPPVHQAQSCPQMGTVWHWPRGAGWRRWSQSPSRWIRRMLVSTWYDNPLLLLFFLTSHERLQSY